MIKWIFYVMFTIKMSAELEMAREQRTSKVTNIRRTSERTSERKRVTLLERTRSSKLLSELQDILEEICYKVAIWNRSSTIGKVIHILYRVALRFT